MTRLSLARLGALGTTLAVMGLRVVAQPAPVSSPCWKSAVAPRTAMRPGDATQFGDAT